VDGRPPWVQGTSQSGPQVGFPRVINDIDFSPRLLYLFGHNLQKFGAAIFGAAIFMDDDFRRGLSGGLTMFVLAALVFLVVGHLWEWWNK
jgi:hypothetical protein